MKLGTKLNKRYEIRELIGEGATATVYRGIDELLGREVALKILLPHVRNTTRERFFQEAMAAAQLNHPNIMAIYDRGDDNDRHFLVVEYVRGEALTNYIPSSVETTVALGAQIANALHYAHEREIIHRDIKPANIMVTPEGQVKIMDLGLALPREAKRVTAPGMVIGTPAYISPEQAKGRQLDRRTDIYSLGIVLYEMVTGQLPFNADDITALLLQHVQQPPPPPRLLATQMPVALESVILKTLEKDANRRYQSANSLADALQAAIMNVPNTGDAALQEQRGEAGQDARITSQSARVKTIRVVLADDHTLLRRTLASYLETHDDILVIAEAQDGEQALEATLSSEPDILLLDLNMPGKNGLEVLPELRAKAPQVKVLVLTGRDEDLYIMRALRSGANGYVLKSIDEQKLVDSIRQVMQGELVLGRGVAEKVVGGLLNSQGDPKKLSETETDIILHIAAGFENEAIGRRLGLSMTQMIETVATVMDKLGVQDRNSAALKALRTGVILLEDIYELQQKQ